MINNFPISRNFKIQIGFVPQHGGYFHDLTVYENLRAIAEITIDNKSFRDEKIDSLISKFELMLWEILRQVFYRVAKKN